MADIQKMIEEVKGMTVLELNELVKALEEEFGVSAAAPVAVAAAPAAAEAAPAAEEKTEFNLVLKEVGEGGVKLIKLVKDVTGLGLIESKALAVAGKTLKENVSKEDADKVIASFKEIGAVVVAE
ncbi:MAG: 50S ribosomal protein L7/L12 [Clostridiales bacterium]|nr:50S ribosomal protein L7/L12 [Clostridiales bacterium]